MLWCHNYAKFKPEAGTNALQPFLNENWLDCNENLEVGNFDPSVQILQLRYYEKSSHSLQNKRIA